MLSGTKGVSTYISRTLTAMMALPMTMKGRNLPNLPLVRSIRAPMKGSVTASSTRMAVTMTEAKTAPSSRTLLPKVAT